MIGMGRTLSVYLGLRYLKALAAVFCGVMALIMVIDFVELIRRAADIENVSLGTLLSIALLRAPVFGEQILSFAVLFGAMICFLNLSRRSELVIARSAGLSAWQFLFPALALSLVLGLSFMTLYNPLAAKMKDRADAIEAKVFGKQTRLIAQKGGQVWFRQKSVDGDAIFRAETASEQGTLLSTVTVYAFDGTGMLLERIEAQSAKLQSGTWEFTQARVFTLHLEPQNFETYVIPTNLTEQQVQESLTAPDTVGFWSLPALIERTERAGLEASRYRMQYHTLMARPLLLIAMILIAASVSLSVFRFGGVPRMILSGIAAGFVLYVLTKMAGDLGDAGIVAPPVAAWTPALLGTMLGAVVLLFREDG